MTTPSALKEYNWAEEPARALLERLGWPYVLREALAAERRARGTAERGGCGPPCYVSMTG